MRVEVSTAEGCNRVNVTTILVVEEHTPAVLEAGSDRPDALRLACGYAQDEGTGAGPKSSHHPLLGKVLRPAVLFLDESYYPLEVSVNEGAGLPLAAGYTPTAGAGSSFEVMFHTVIQMSLSVSDM